MNHESRRGGVAWIGVGAIALLGLALRLWDLTGRTFSHPENYASGLNMPEWMPMVTRRVDFGTFFYGTLADGHPPLYYAFGLLWTKVVGTDLWALRLPSVLFGTATILVVYAIGLRVASRRTALIAAGLLALHGHHIFYSQVARLYVFAGFFAALSTLFLLRAWSSDRTRDRVAYMVATTCALWSHLYCWPLVFTQLVWSTLASASRRQPSPVLVSQAVAILLATPVVALTLYQNPPNRWVEDAAGYFGLGYALDPVLRFWSAAPSFPGEDLWIRVAITLALVVAGVLATRTTDRDDRALAKRPELSTRSWSGIVLVGTVMAASIVFFAQRTAPRHTISPDALRAIALLPLVIALGIPLYLKYDHPRFLQRAWFVRLTRVETLPAWLAFLPVACMLGVSLVRASFTARGTLIFLPFLMLAVALGIDALFKWRWIGRIALATVTVVMAFSARYFSLAQSSPRDYAGLARSLRQVLAPDDLILVRSNTYVDGPLLYYFPAPFAQFIGRDHAETLKQRGHRSRVWIIQWRDNPVASDLQRAIDGYKPGPVVTVYQGSATAYLPP